MRWRIWWIDNGCASQQLVARRDVIAPEFISYGLNESHHGTSKSLLSRSCRFRLAICLVIRAINRKFCLKLA